MHLAYAPGDPNINDYLSAVRAKLFLPLGINRATIPPFSSSLFPGQVAFHFNQPNVSESLEFDDRHLALDSYTGFSRLGGPAGGWSLAAIDFVRLLAAVGVASGYVSSSAFGASPIFTHGPAMVNFFLLLPSTFISSFGAQPPQVETLAGWFPEDALTPTVYGQAGGFSGTAAWFGLDATTGFGYAVLEHRCFFWLWSGH